jgi:hypothetical protein
LKQNKVISFEYFYYLLDSSHHADDVVHQLVPVDSLDLQFASALHALLVVALLAAEAVVVSTGDDCDWVVEFVAEGTLDLWNDAVIQMLKTLHTFL